MAGYAIPGGVPRFVMRGATICVVLAEVQTQLTALLTRKTKSVMLSDSHVSCGASG